ncbi:MAG: GNAT family N-acetyltransferase [Gammaproteobacteria bacterium]|nr:GNAT family N-acetyltransferase [Gammaproteobacteria bacterium]
MNFNENMRALGVSGKVIGCHAVDNIASGRVLEKSGFKRDGEKAFNLPNGEVVMDPQWMILL